jgi:hypothetical protein
LINKIGLVSNISFILKLNLLNISLTFLLALEIAELKEEDMPMV